MHLSFSKAAPWSVAVYLCAASVLLACGASIAQVPSTNKRVQKPLPVKTPEIDISTPTEFPQRKPGLWEIRTTAAHSMGLAPAMFCVGDTTDNAKDHLDRGYGEKGSCRTGPFRQMGQAFVSESVCREARNVVSSRSIATGDFSSTYRIDTQTSYSLIQGPRRDDSEAIEGRYVNPCPANMRAGDLLIPGMGRINMVDGSVQVPKQAKRKPSKKS
jgi:hypothetical protein